MTCAVVNQKTDFTITLTDQNIDFTEFKKSYITLHITMDITFDGGFPLSLFTKQPGPPPNWNAKWLDFNQLQTCKAHNLLYLYEIPVLLNLQNNSSSILDLNIPLIVFKKYQ
jgi:hypothetical protein